MLEKVRMQTFGFARMDPEQIRAAILSGIVALGKGSGLLNNPSEFKWEVWGNRPVGLSPDLPMGTHLAKKEKKIIWEIEKIC